MGNPVHSKFKQSEFACKCGKCGKGFADMRADTLSKLYLARDLAGIGFNISSAFRCPEHNAAEGGRPNSSHLRGRAVDIDYTTMEQGYTILKALLDAGFPRVGINYAKTFIHVDDDPTLPKGLFPY
jgi:zinc D-Ala-D-Ala carboxypeptidase